MLTRSFKRKNKNFMLQTQIKVLQNETQCDNEQTDVHCEEHSDVTYKIL